MSETQNSGVIRCRRCDNFFPAVTDYSFHRCGAHGSMMIEKNKGVDFDPFSEKSNEVENRYERLNMYGRRMVDLGDGSEGDARSNISSSSRLERRKVLVGVDENYRPTSINSVEKWVKEADSMEDEMLQELQRAKTAQHFDELSMYNKDENSYRSATLADGRNGERSEAMDLRRAQRMDHEVIRYRREGYDYESLGNNRKNIDGYDDRAELLRQLDELKHQLSRSGDLIRKGNEEFPLDNRRLVHQDPYGSENWYPNSPLGMNREAVQRFYNDTQFKRPPYHNQQQTSHAYISTKYVNDDMVYRDNNNMEPYPRVVIRNNNRQVPPTAYSEKYYDKPSSFGSQGYYNHGISALPSLRSRDTPSHSRWPSDLNSEVDGFVRRPPPRVQLTSNGQLLRTFSGGAPFLACYSCFQLLLLPKKVTMTKNEAQKKVRCGACSTVIPFAVSNKNLVVSTNKVATNTVVSDDYDKSGDDFHSMDRDRGNNNSTIMENRNSGFKCTSDVKEDVESTTQDSYSADLAPPPPLAGSTLQDYFEYSNKFHRASHPVEGNGTALSNSKYNKVSSNWPISRRKESSATEISVSSFECSNTGTTSDSGEACRDGDYLKGRIAVSSNLADIREKSPIGSNRYTDEPEKASVTVNGHLIPDQLIKKAQKMAGPIRPGNYWYDFQAGFWGAVGGPCLGIIPPFIEEFNYPMPEHCAGGNTRVYVNRRELNQKDLNLLCGRGLPADKDRWYMIEISGKVVDEATGEELQSLGQLAPTVKKANHGFGMRCPKAVSG